MVKNVKRTVDVAPKFVKINTRLTLSNEGQSTLKFFHFVVEDEAFAKVSYIGATVSGIKYNEKEPQIFLLNICDKISRPILGASKAHFYSMDAQEKRGLYELLWLP